MVRVRFAPSPTGFLHIGGVRTALFNWLFARHHRGLFILRVEDTDKARSKQVFLERILDDLRWLGLDWDEGPFFQSQRLAIYQENAQQLLRQGAAYRQGQAIILKVPDRAFEFSDLIRGPIKFAAGTFKDQVLIKSDGTPTYNFACCCDDHNMRISHVIRGDDHISNTPKQLAIYQALGLQQPKFAHIPLIVDAQRARLSKRKGAMPISYYQEQGYLPEALFNFLALLGWSLGKNREIASREEIISEFNLERALKTAAYFDTDKLDWMNGQYLQQLPAKELHNRLHPFLLKEKYIPKDYDQKKLLEIIKLLQPRIKRLTDFMHLADFFFLAKIRFAPGAKEFMLKSKRNKEVFKKLIQVLNKLHPFDVQNIERASRCLIAEEGIRAGELIHPVRVALTGKRVGPGLFELMAVLGKQGALLRLTQAVEMKYENKRRV